MSHKVQKFQMFPLWWNLHKDETTSEIMYIFSSYCSSDGPMMGIALNCHKGAILEQNDINLKKGLDLKSSINLKPKAEYKPPHPQFHLLPITE